METEGKKLAPGLTPARLIALSVRDIVEARDALTAALKQLETHESIADIQVAMFTAAHGQACIARVVQYRQMAEMIAHKA